MTAPATLLFLGTEDDREYTPRLKSMVGVATVYVSYMPLTTITEVTMYCKKKGITGVITTSVTLLKLLLNALGNPRSSPSLDSYAGSYFTNSGIEFVFIHPLEHLSSVSYALFITKRFISKLTEPETWNESPAFKYELVTATNVDTIFASYHSAYAIAIDIETLKDPLSIRCIGYSAIFILNGSVTVHSCVLPIDGDFALAWMRKFNWELKAPKIFQNGKYDISYLSRYNAVPYNYLWDTAHLFHSWYSELPKDLAFLGAFFVRKAMYWKDLAETNDLSEYYRYNALDTYTTALVWMEQMLQAPEWARNNYLMEFPLVFPCHLSEMTGMKRDMARLEAARAEIDSLIDTDNASLSRMVGTYPLIFNVNSAPQNKALRTILGCSDIGSSDEKSLTKIGSRHPINRRITNKILDIRGNRKLASTYLTTGEKAKELNGRILYSLNPHGTDTGRLASKEHHFWCGLQIQNIPRGKAVKQTIVADAGFMFAEADLKQAESRDTAYISGDETLIAAVSGTRDFHAVNASSFFGTSYDKIFDDATGKTLDKKLRDLAKRTNHGATYLMGASVMLDTMGDEKVWEAKKLLGLPSAYGLLDVTKHLLSVFHRTYPSLESVFYPSVVHEVITTGMLVGGTGWTRRCFDRPDKNKLAKNAYVAHMPQSLNAMKLNKAFMRVFYEIAIAPEYAPHFKLCAQIHDSILFQFREGHEYLMDMVSERMGVPLTLKGYDGKTRTYTVPADVKAGKDGKGSKYWSDTE
jgi:DNA polymerase I-like protein with 3'-5' exonuclease and polymerase domains